MREYQKPSGYKSVALLEVLVPESAAGLEDAQVRVGNLPDGWRGQDMREKIKVLKWAMQVLQSKEVKSEIAAISDK